MTPDPLMTFKPDLAETRRRWAAYWAGELLDRPPVCATVWPKDFDYQPQGGYRDRVEGDFDDLIDRALHNAAGALYGGEAMPSFCTTFGPDEAAVFCGAQFAWSQSGTDTNWSVPFVEDWEQALPLRLREDSPLWQRMLAFHRRAAERLAGRMWIQMIDLHTNMDLLAGVRDSQRLCLDAVDQPELIDRAMADARAMFPVVWHALRAAGRLEEHGRPPEDAVTLQCDFSALISPAMFRRWVRPALEEEAALVPHAFYHWDGPRALVHFDELMSIAGLHTFAYVPDPGERHIEYLDLYRCVQAAGKAVAFGGRVDEIRIAHKALRPDKIMYYPEVGTAAELNALLDWLKKNT